MWAYWVSSMESSWDWSSFIIGENGAFPCTFCVDRVLGSCTSFIPLKMAFFDRHGSVFSGWNMRTYWVSRMVSIWDWSSVPFGKNIAFPCAFLFALVSINSTRLIIRNWAILVWHGRVSSGWNMWAFWVGSVVSSKDWWSVVFGKNIAFPFAFCLDLVTGSCTSLIPRNRAAFVWLGRVLSEWNMWAFSVSSMVFLWDWWSFVFDHFIAFPCAFCLHLVSDSWTCFIPMHMEKIAFFVSWHGHVLSDWRMWAYWG
jgi:hypothetical protein